MSVFTHFSYHSRRGLVEIPDECWSYFHHPDELGAHSGTLHLLPGREHAPHYYYGVIPYQVTQGLPVQIIDFDEILLI